MTELFARAIAQAPDQPTRELLRAWARSLGLTIRSRDVLKYL